MDLKGKRVLFLGSSVTYGAAAGGVSFAEVTAEMCGFECVKEAVSGTTLADIKENSYVNRLKRKVDENQHFDLFVCQLSTNDCGKVDDFSYTESAIRHIIGYVEEKFGCPIMFYTSPKCGGTKSRYDELVNLLWKLQAEYGFAVFDMWNDPTMSREAIGEEKFAYYMKDAFHPFLAGYTEWWAPRFVEFFEKL